MKTIRFFRLLVLRIVILSVMIFAWTFITDLIQASTGFFGDLQYQKYSWVPDLSWKWGWRHYLWSGMGVVLVFVSIARIWVWGEWYWSQISKTDDVDLNSPENKLF